MTFNPSNRPGSFGRGDLESQKFDAEIDERVVVVEAGSGGGLAAAQFSITHGSGDGDFKLTAASSTEKFDLAAWIAANIGDNGQGILVATELNVTEAFNNIGTNVGLRMNASDVTPSGGFLFHDPSGTPDEFSSLHTAGVKRGYTPGENVGASAKRSYLGPDEGAEYGPNVEFGDFSLGPNVNLATTGKIVVTLHYIPLPTAIS